MGTNDKVIYTDGHKVTITDSTLKVNKKEYRLLGITRHGFLALKPHRTPGIFLIVVGVLMLLAGALGHVPATGFQGVRVLDRHLNVDNIAVVVGSTIAIGGLMFAFLVKPKYAVWIYTAEGELNAVVSQHQEYIKQIIDGLNRAFMSKAKVSKA